MNLYVDTIDYQKTIEMARSLSGDFEPELIFHCYWYGDLNEKNLISIRSCWFFNAREKRNRKIILWIEKSNPNFWWEEISLYAEIREFDLGDQLQRSCLSGSNISVSSESITYYSDLARLLLLFNYGGIWFDLDVFFLRSFDPLAAHFSDQIFLYTWSNQDYPNNAIFGSIHKESESLAEAMKFIYERNLGWGFQQAHLNFNLPLNFTVLPCSWFDAGWLDENAEIGLNAFSPRDEIFSLSTFFPGAFAYHWHNQWWADIDSSSIIGQLDAEILNMITYS